MREDASLLQAIAEGDDTARLAYADWLEEHGAPRVAWVRDLRVWRWMTPDAHDPLPALLAALRDDDWRCHDNAVSALGVVGAPAVAALMQMLTPHAEEPDAAMRAGEALALMPREALELHLPALFELAAHEDDAVRGPAIHALKAVGVAALPALQSLVAALETGQEGQPVSEAAAAVLRNIGPPAVEALPDLVILGSSEPEIRETVEAAIVAVAANAPAELLDAIVNSEDENQLWAAAPLRAIGPAVVPVLREAIRDTDEDELARWRREAAALALAAYDPEAALPVLVDALARCAGDWREEDAQFAEAIRAVGPAAALVADRLRELLPVVGWSAGKTLTEVLAKLGEADAVRASLFRQFADPDPAERAAALSALVHVDDLPDHLIPSIVACLDIEGAQGDACSLLDRLAKGPQRPALWPSLLTLTQHASSEVAVWAIGVLAETPDGVEETLHACLRDHRANVRVAALEASVGVVELADEFLRLAGDAETQVQAAAALRLGDTGAMSPPIAVALQTLLRSEVPDVRESAMRAVAVRGPVACGVAATLVQLARQDSAVRVRERAIACIPECGLPLPQAVTLLRSCLSDDNEDGSHRAAAFALSVLAEQPSGREAVLAALPDLITHVNLDESVRALVRLGAVAVPALIANLSKNPLAETCAALGQLGDVQALPALIDALSFSERNIRQAAACAIAAIGQPAPAAIGPLRRMLWADTEGEANAAILALAGIGATAAFDDLARLAQTAEHRAVALWAAARLGDATALLRQALDSPCDEVRAIATVELARRGMGPRPTMDDLYAMTSIPALRGWLLDEMTRSDDPDVLPAAARASRRGDHALHSLGIEVLQRIGHRDPEAAVEALATAYQCHDESVLGGLAKLGAGSRRAYRFIVQRMNGYRPSVRAAGVAALRQVLPSSPPVS